MGIKNFFRRGAKVATDGASKAFQLAVKLAPEATVLLPPGVGLLFDKIFEAYGNLQQEIQRAKTAIKVALVLGVVNTFMLVGVVSYLFLK